MGSAVHRELGSQIITNGEMGYYGSFSLRECACLQLGLGGLDECLYQPYQYDSGHGSGDALADARI